MESCTMEEALKREERFEECQELLDSENELDALQDHPTSPSTELITIKRPSRLQMALIGGATIAAGTASFLQIELYYIAGGIGAGIFLVAAAHALIKAKARKNARKPRFTEDKINYLRARYKARTEDHT